MHQFALVVARFRHTVVVGCLAARHVGAGKIVEREGGFGTQAGRDEFQVLLNGKERFQFAACAAVVAVLRTHRPRVVAVGGSQWNRTVRIDRRMHKWRGLERFGKHFVGRGVGLAQHLQVTAYVESQQGGLRYVQIHICPQVESVEFRAGVVGERLVGSHDALLVVVRSGERVAQTLRAARHRQVRTGRVGHFVGDGIHPIHIGVEVTVVAVVGLEDLVFGE